MKPSCEQSSYELILFLVSHNWWLRFACSLPLSHGCFVQQYVIGAERWSKWFEPSDFTGNIVLWSFKRLCDFKWNNFPFPPQVSRINSCLWVWVAMLQNFFQVNNFPPQVSSCNHSSSIVVMGVSFNAAKPADLVASPSSTVSYLRSCANTNTLRFSLDFVKSFFSFFFFELPSDFQRIFVWMLKDFLRIFLGSPLTFPWLSPIFSSNLLRVSVWFSLDFRVCPQCGDAMKGTSKPSTYARVLWFAPSQEFSETVLEMQFCEFFIDEAGSATQQYRLTFFIWAMFLHAIECCDLQQLCMICGGNLTPIWRCNGRCKGVLICSLARDQGKIIGNAIFWILNAIVPENGGTMPRSTTPAVADVWTKFSCSDFPWIFFWPRATSHRRKTSQNTTQQQIKPHPRNQKLSAKPTVASSGP